MAYTTIDDSSANFQIGQYVGDTSSEVACTLDGNSSMQPDLVWTFDRDVGQSRGWVDSTRGVTKPILTNGNYYAGQYGSTGFVSFDSDGFTVNDESSFWNYGTSKFVSYCLKCNGGTTSTDSNGSEDSTVQVNATAGFSITTFTGTGVTETYGHGLGVKPDIMISKKTSAVGNWYVLSELIDGTFDYLIFNTNAAFANSSYDAPTSSVFSYNENAAATAVMYCFKEIQGFSKFDSFKGNGSDNGTFIHTGFKPAFVMVKNAESSSSTAWRIWDVKRNPGNVANIYSDGDEANAEGTSSVDIDILSNGFKPRVNQISVNESGSKHLFMAFAENPFVTSTSIPTTAR